MALPIGWGVWGVTRSGCDPCQESLQKDDRCYSCGEQGHRAGMYPKFKDGWGLPQGTLYPSREGRSDMERPESMDCNFRANASGVLLQATVMVMLDNKEYLDMIDTGYRL